MLTENLIAYPARAFFWQGCLCMPFTRLSAGWTGLVCLCGIAAGCVSPEKTRVSSSTCGSAANGMPAQATPGTTARFAGRELQDNASNSPLKLASASSIEQRSLLDEVRQRHDEQLAIDAKSVDVVLGQARLDQIGGRKVEAEAGFRRAVRMDNASGRALDALGQFYVDQKRWNDAIATLQKASACAPDDASVRCHYAIALAKSGQISQAIPMLRSAMEPADVHYHIGVILRERGDLAGSEEQFDMALRENPYFEPARQRLADVRRDRELQLASAPSRPPAATNAKRELWDSQR